MSLFLSRLKRLLEFPPRIIDHLQSGEPTRVAVKLHEQVNHLFEGVPGLYDFPILFSHA